MSKRVREQAERLHDMVVEWIEERDPTLEELTELRDFLERMAVWRADGRMVVPKGYDAARRRTLGLKA